MKKIAFLILCLPILFACKRDRFYTPETIPSDSDSDSFPVISGITVRVEDPEEEVDTTSIAFDPIPKSSIHDSINLYLAGMNITQKAIYVSLSDIYQNDSLDVPPEYIKNQKKMNKNFLLHFPLTGKYRKNIFTRMKFSENDTLFLYNYIDNVLKKYPLSSLKAVASLNAYASEEEIDPWDYEIGFELFHSSDSLKREQAQPYWDSFVFIGQESPFDNKGMTPMVWHKVKAKEFPVSYQIENPLYSLGDTYKYESKEVICYIQDFYFDYDKGNYGSTKRYFVALDPSTKRILKRAFLEESEGLFFVPPITDTEGEGLMLIGRILKGKPLAIYGMTSASFGCDPLIFLSDEQGDIYIQCDNRH